MLCHVVLCYAMLCYALPYHTILYYTTPYHTIPYHTILQPHTFLTMGYLTGIHAPGRCSDRTRCEKGNSDTEPYIAGHNVIRWVLCYAVLYYAMLCCAMCAMICYAVLCCAMLCCIVVCCAVLCFVMTLRFVCLPKSHFVFCASSLPSHNSTRAHAAAVGLYRRQYKGTQHGAIGITLNQDWGEPFNSSSSADIAAANRRNVYQLAWFADPVFFGVYPIEMRDILGNRLPTFSQQEKNSIIGSTDFLGLNHYASNYVQSCGAFNTSQFACTIQENTVSTPFNASGHMSGPLGASAWLHVAPWGFYNMLTWNSARYRHPLIYVTENGVDVPGVSIVLCCAVLCYAMLCCAILCCAVLLCCVMLCWAMLCCAMLCSAILWYYAML
jgi:hypothetical protein